MEEKIAKIYFCVFVCIISFLIFIIIGIEASKEYYIKQHKYELVDTTYNHIILDSIQYIIEEKDSVIKVYRKEIEYEKDKAINASDSDVVKQFKELVSE